MKKKNVLYVLALTSLFLVSCSSNSSSGTSSSSNQTNTSSTETNTSVNQSTSSSSQTSESSEMKGQGSKESPYVIENKAQLIKFQEISLEDSYRKAYYSLEADIDYGGDEWTPIGSTNFPFEGVFEGNNHIIKNLKITQFDKDIQSYGLFSAASEAKITNLKIEALDVSLKMFGTDSTYYYGGLIGYAVNSYVGNVDINYKSHIIQSLQNGNSRIYSGGLIGQFSADNENGTTYYLEVASCAVHGDLKNDLSDAASSVMDSLGGLVGIVNTNYYSGIIAINHSYFEGNLIGGTYVAGISPYLSYLSSVVDSYAVGDYIKATNTEGAYAGGIGAYAQAETAILNCYAEYNTIDAQASTSTVYKSYASTICAIFSKTTDNYDDNSSAQGLALFNNYAKVGTKVTGDVVEVTATEKTISGQEFNTILNYQDNFWTIGESYPTLKGEGRDFKATITFDKNYSNAGTNDTLAIDAGSFSAEFATKVTEDQLTRDHYSYYGYSYDKEGTVSVRWYAPINHDISVYASWASLENLVGSYNYECQYYDKITATGQWKFDEEYFYWIGSDHMVLKYTYHFDGTYIFFDEATKLENGYSGGYEGSIFKFENGKITGYDVNSAEATYSATKSNTNIVIPTYENKAYLGKWYNSKVSLNMYSDGSVKSTSFTSTVEYYGGFIEQNGEVSISVWSKISGTYKYDETNDIFYNSSEILSRTNIDKVYLNTDSTIYATVTNNKTYIVNNGTLENILDKVIQEGEELTIGGKKYVVEGSTLKDSSSTVDPVEPDTPSTDTKTYYGTWKGKVGYNNVTVVLNEDGTGTYNGSSFTYEENNGAITTSMSSISMSYDKDKNSLTVNYVDEDEEFNFTGTLTDFTPATKEDTPSTSEVTLSDVIGTYQGTWGNGNVACSLTLNEDKTGSFTNGILTFTFNYEVDSQGVFTISNFVDSTYCYENLRLTYNKEKDQITGLVYENDQMMADFNISLTSHTK